jgi:hypothetical protein
VNNAGFRRLVLYRLQVGLGAFNHPVGRCHDGTPFVEFRERVLEPLVADDVHVERDNDRRAGGADFAMDEHFPPADVVTDRRQRLLELPWRHRLRIVERQLDVLDPVARAVPPGVHVHDGGDPERIRNRKALGITGVAELQPLEDSGHHRLP